MLHQQWETLWGIKVPGHLSRQMIEKSIAFRVREQRGEIISGVQQKKLEALIKSHQKSPGAINRHSALRLGARLVRIWKGKTHAVTVAENGFTYNGQHFTSLSQIAFIITGTRWNGWVFFGVKREKSHP